MWRGIGGEENGELDYTRRSVFCLGVLLMTRTLPGLMREADHEGLILAQYGYNSCEVHDNQKYGLNPTYL